MAYNYEYPYVDPGVYNDDWLIHSMQKLIEDWAKFNTDVVDKWDEFLINAKEEYDTFTAEIRQIQSNFEREFNIRWANYQTTMSTQWQEFQSSVNRQQTEFEIRMTQRYEEFTNNLTQEMDTYRDNINKRVTDFETGVDEDIADMLREIADFKTFVNNYLDNLDITQEVSNKIDNMVDNGTFASSVRPDVVTAASDWLTQHITNPSNPPLDKSLQTSSAAAESAYTGHRMFPLLSNCGLYIKTEDFTIDKKAVSATDGTLINSNYSKSTELFPYQAEQGQYIYAVISPVVSSAVASIAFYSVKNKFISSYRYSNPNYDLQLLKIPVPNGTSYVRACMYKGSDQDVFCCIVGEQDPLWANFALRSRFYSATETQRNGIDTSNGILQSTAAVNSTIWFDIAQHDPVGKIEFDSFLDTTESMTEQWRISFVVGNLERLYMRLLRNRISLLNNAQTEISGADVDVDRTLGHKHVTLIRANQLLLIYTDGVLLYGFAIKDILQVGYYIIQSSSLISNFNYQPLKIRRPKVAVTIDTCYWMGNPMPLLEQLRTIHNKYNCDITLHITGSQGEESLDTITAEQSQEFIVDNGWLKFSVYRENINQHATVNGLNQLKTKIVNKFGWRSYDPYPIIVQNNMSHDDLVNLYNRHVILGVTALSTDLASEIQYGLSDVEKSVLTNGFYYPDLKTGLTYYMCVGDVFNDAHLSNLETRIYTQTIIAKMNVPIIGVCLSSETEIGEMQLTRLNKALTYYYNKAGIAVP